MLPLLFSLLTTPAPAGEWEDFVDAFPTLPCADGWAGCLVGQQPLSAEPVRDTTGVPVPSGWGVSW